MNEILNNLAARAPELFFGFLFIAALWIVLREYRRIGAGIRESVQTEVAAQLGRTMGDLRISAEEAGRVQESIRTMHEEVRRATEEFDARVTAQETAVDERFQHLRDRVAKYELSLPEDAEDAKIPAAQVVHALQNATTWAEAAGQIDTLAEDPDATSRNLEFAGDRAREFGQFTLALQLYDLARHKDPDRETVAIEYLTLKAEQNYEEREKALEEAIEVTVADPNEIIMARLANTLIELGRFELLEELCTRLLASETVASRAEIVGLCHRNLGTAYRELNQPERAREEFRNAYEMDPENENLLKGYANHLLDEGEYEATLPLWAELIHLDPFDSGYYYLLGSTLERLRRPEEAIHAFALAEETAADPPQADRALRARARLEAVRNLPEFVSELRAGQGVT